MKEDERARAGQRAALVIVGSGLFWAGAWLVGDRMGLSNRERALLDLMALAGFGYGLWLTWKVSRAGR